MFTTPSTNYITATKLIESFSCFFDKINSTSADPAFNAQKLAQIKQILYSNIHSQENITNATHDLCNRRPEESRFTPCPVTLYSPRLLEQSQRIEVSEFTVPKNYLSVPVAEQMQVANQEGYNDEKLQLNTEYLPATSFLGLIRAACHNDMSKLFPLSSHYSYIRTFTDNKQSVFTALCFAFLEKLVKQKGKDSQFYLTQGYHQRRSRDCGPHAGKEVEFLDFFRMFCQTSNEFDLTRRFYELIAGNPGFYQSAMSIFKQHIRRVLSGRPQNMSSEDEESFEWMDDLDQAEDTSYCQGLTQVFKKNIKFLILTRTKLVEKMFYYENYGYSQPLNDFNSKSELTIFFDKMSKTSFILYPHDKSIDEDLDASFTQRSKAKVNTAAPTVYAKPPLNNDSLKSLKSLGENQANANGSLSTLDTVNTLSSLNDLENKDRSKAGPANRPHVLKKAGTLNVVTSSLNDCGSPSFSYPESAQVRPCTDKVYYAEFHSATKDLGLHRLRTEEDVLMRKDREPTPSRPSTTHRYLESPAEATDRTFSEVSSRLDFSRQTMNTMHEENREREIQERSSYFDRSPIKECINLRAYMSETKDKSEQYYGRGAPVEAYSQRNSHVRGPYESPMMPVFRPMALPILLKNKIDRFNQTVNQNDEELAGTVGKYLRNEGRNGERTQGRGLGNIMGVYQMIVNQNEENSRRSNFGMIMRMDI